MSVRASHPGGAFPRQGAGSGRLPPCVFGAAVSKAALRAHASRALAPGRRIDHGARQSAPFIDLDDVDLSA